MTDVPGRATSFLLIPSLAVEGDEQIVGRGRDGARLLALGLLGPSPQHRAGVLAEFLVAKASRRHGNTEGGVRELRCGDAQRHPRRGQGIGVLAELAAARAVEYDLQWLTRARGVRTAVTARCERSARTSSSFALQACRDRERYNPLDVRQWKFRVLPARVIRDAGSRSVGLGFPDRHGVRPVSWSELAAAIDTAFEAEEDET